MIVPHHRFIDPGASADVDHRSHANSSSIPSLDSVASPIFECYRINALSQTAGDDLEILRRHFARGIGISHF